MDKEAQVIILAGVLFVALYCVINIGFMFWLRRKSDDEGKK